MRIYNLFLILATATSLIACEADKGETLQANIPTNANVTTFVDFDLDPDNTVIPFPINILFSGSLDGTLNIPAQTGDTAGQTAVKASLNALDGFSTVAPISIGFTDAMDDTTFPTGVRIFEVSQDFTNPALPLVDGITAELTFGVDFVAVLSSLDTTNASMVILPLIPLKPKTTYMVTLTSALLSADGNPVGPAQTYVIVKGAAPLVDADGNSQSGLLDNDQAAGLEPLRQITNSGESNLLAFDDTIGAADIIMSWQFTTQSVGDVLTVARSLVNAPAPAPATTFALSTVDLDGMGPALPGETPGRFGDLYTGTIDIPYYLTVSANGVNSTDPTALGSSWQALNTVAGETNLTKFNPLPTPTDAALTIPMLVSTPMTASPWPVVIFQHGITANRTSMLAVADLLAVAGFAVVAIDMPMHGLNAASGFYDAPNERTFNLDLVTQDPMTGAITNPVPDMLPDSSGRHFINLSVLLNTRDNVRQAVADLFAVAAAIPTMDVDGGGADFDAANIYFVGHSLGAMVGTAFLALEPNVKDAVLANPGTSLPKILDGSATFGPDISVGLAANGVVKGTTDFEAFLASAQMVVDSGDPVNYATTAVTGRGILLFEVVGGNGSPSDLVVPNTVPDGNDMTGTIPAPLAGTEPQIALMGLTHINAAPTAGTNLKLTTKFISGDHSSFLTTAADAAVTAEMQAEMISFLSGDGDSLAIADDTVLAAPVVP